MKHMQRVRDLLGPHLNRETPAGWDERFVVDVLIGGGGPTEWLTLSWSDKAEYSNLETPMRATYLYRYGSDTFDYPYPADDIPVLWERLSADPEPDDG